MSLIVRDINTVSKMQVLDALDTFLYTNGVLLA